MKGSDASRQISSSKIKFPSLNPHQKLTNSIPITNSSNDKTDQKNMNGFCTSQRLKKNHEDQIGSHKNILIPSYGMPSKDISSVSSTFKCKKSRLEDSKSVHKKVIADDNMSNGSLESRKNSVANLLSSVSGVKKGASSFSLREQLKKYETYKDTSTPIRRNNHPVFDVSKMISPVTSENTFLSSLANKESKNHVGKYNFFIFIFLNCS